MEPENKTMTPCYVPLAKLFSSDSKNTQGRMPQSVERAREDHTLAVSSNLTGMEQLRRVHGREKLSQVLNPAPTHFPLALTPCT